MAPNTVISLETKVANQVLAKTQENVTETTKIDFEFTAEQLADFYHPKDNLFLDEVGNKILKRHEPDFKDIGIAEAVDKHMIP